eukprot:s1824_g6.t1
MDPGADGFRPAESCQVTGSTGEGTPEKIQTEFSEDCPDASPREEAECHVDLQDVAGDYSYRSPDGLESRLRLQPGGTWWHSTYRSSHERIRLTAASAKSQKYRSFVKAYKDSAFEEIPPARDLESLATGDFQEVQVWELAEALGTWQLDQHGAILTCQHWSWKCSHPGAPMVLEPSLETRQQLNQLLDSEELQLCYVATAERSMELQTKGHPSWDLQQRHQRLRSLQAAFQTLGFARSYTPGWPAEQSGSAGAEA